KQIREAETHISAFEQEAHNIAKDQGYRWESGNYYSERAKQREEKIQKYLKARTQVERSRFAKGFGFPQGLFNSWTTLLQNPSLYDSKNNRTFNGFFEAVYGLNQDNLIAREQCLTPLELNGDSSLINLDSGDTPSWEMITQEFYSGLLIQKKRYGVYQLEFIKHHALKSATERPEDMTSFLGADTPENMFERALSVYEAAIQALDAWKSLATSRVRNNQIQYFCGWCAPGFKQLVWNNDGGKWSAKPHEFGQKPGYKIIECYRNSTNSRPNYVRESWLTDDVWMSCYSIKLLPITPDTFKLDLFERPEVFVKENFEPGRRTEQLRRQRDNALKRPEVRAEAMLWTWEKGFVDTVEAVWRHKIAVSYSNRGGLVYDTSAEAQMMRFTSGLSLSDTV